MTATSPSTPSTPQPLAPRWVQSLRRIVATQEGILSVTLIVLVVAVSLINPRFLSEGNVYSVLASNAYIAVAAIGISMVIISGNIDISVGPLINALVILCGSLATSGWGLPVWVSWLGPLVVGALVGALIGFFVAYLHIPAIVASLGLYSILKGGIVLLAEGKVIYDLPDGFGLSQMMLFDKIPMPIVIMIVLTIIAALWMRYSPTSRAIYAVGGNAEAARLSGINVRRVLMVTFILSGITGGVASVMLATQFSQIQISPSTVELLIITAAVVGGVSILGGTGTVIGAMLAAVLLAAIRTAMPLVSVSPYWSQAVQGFLILVAVLADIYRRRRQLASGE